MDADALEVVYEDFDGRRLAESLRAVVRMKYPTAGEADVAKSELDWNSLLDEVEQTLQQSDDLSGIDLVEMSGAELSWVTVECPARAAAPPGVTVMRPDDCVCKPGYGYDGGACRICAFGQYKSRLADVSCQTAVPEINSEGWCHATGGVHMSTWYV